MMVSCRFSIIKFAYLSVSTRVLISTSPIHLHHSYLHSMIEYDDYYCDPLDDDDDEDFDGNAFEAQYLSTGIDLSNSKSNNISSSNKNRQLITDDAEPNLVKRGVTTVGEPVCDINSSEGKSPSTGDGGSTNTNVSPPFKSASNDIDSIRFASLSEQQKYLTYSVTSDLTKLAIQHLDKHQWQLPLMDMDKKFRDKTYYKHYTESYITSLRSKLGHFLADHQLLTNPMRFHLKQELDNYSKYSRMFELLTDYYQSLGSGFFSFATPSPDEDIIIGCRLGTKGYYRPHI